MRHSIRLQKQRSAKRLPYITNFKIKIPVVHLKRGYGRVKVSAYAELEIKKRISDSGTRFLIESFKVEVKEKLGKWGRIGRITSCFSDSPLYKEELEERHREQHFPIMKKVMCADLFKECQEVGEESTSTDRLDDIYFVYDTTSSPNNTVTAHFTVTGCFIEQKQDLESRLRKIQKFKNTGRGRRPTARRDARRRLSKWHPFSIAYDLLVTCKDFVCYLFN